MKRLSYYIFLISISILIPLLGTKICMGGKKSTEPKMGITVLKKNGEKIDGESQAHGLMIYLI